MWQIFQRIESLQTERGRADTAGHGRTAVPTARPSPSPSPSSRPGSRASASRPVILIPWSVPLASPKAQWTRQSAPATPTPSSVPAFAPEVDFSISVVSTPNILGIYLPPLSLVWSSAVTVNSQVVDQRWQVSWSLYDGSALIYAATSLCNGTYELPMLLTIGDYRQ